MSVKVEVEIDPKAASTGIKVIADDLTKLEAKGKTTGKTLAQALGELGKEAEAEKAIEELTASLEHEANVLRSLREPTRLYNTELALMDRLLKADKITTAEYAMEVTRLNKQLQATLPIFDEWDRKAHEAAKSAAEAAAASKSPGAGAGKEVLGAVAGGLGIGLSVGALATQAVDLIGNEINAWREKEKVIREATNTLVKYYDNADQAKAALEAQKDLARDLHVGLNEAVGAYDAVRQATDGMYLSSGQFVEITKTLGQVMIMNNRPVGDAAQVMQKLQYAMSVGNFDALAFKGIAKEFPDIMNTWAQATGKSTKELIKLSEEGRLGTEEVRNFALALEHSDEVQKQMGKRLQTDEGVLHAYGNMMRETIDVHYKQRKATEALVDALERGALSAQRAADEMKKYKTGSSDVGAVIDGLNNKLQQLGTLINDPWDASGPSDFAKKIKSAIDLEEPTLKAKADLKNLDAAWAMTAEHSGGAAKRYRESRKALEETITGVPVIDYYKEQLDALQKPEKDWHGRLAAIGKLHHDNTMNVQQYDVALRNLIKTYAGMDVVGGIDALNNKKTSGALNNERMNRYDTDINSQNMHAGLAEDFGADVDQTFKNSPSDLSADVSQLEASLALHKQINAKIVENAKATQEWNAEIHKNNIGEQAMVSTLEAAGTSLADNLVAAANGADVSWTAWGENILTTFEKAIAQALILKAIGSSTGGIGGAGTGILGALFGGGAYGFDSVVGYGKGMHTPGFATGGDAMIGGRGSTDSKLAVFKVTPGEHLSIRTPQQKRAAEEASSSGGAVVHNHISIDVEKRALAAMDGREFDQKIVNSLNRVRGAARQILSK